MCRPACIKGRAQAAAKARRRATWYTCRSDPEILGETRLTKCAAHLCACVRAHAWGVLASFALPSFAHAFRAFMSDRARCVGAHVHMRSWYSSSTYAWNHCSTCSATCSSVSHFPAARSRYWRASPSLWGGLPT